MSKLSDEVLADARRKADRRRRSAKRDAEKIVEQARAHAEQEASRVRDDGRRRADRQRQQILATVGQEVRRRRLLRQAGCIEARIQAGFDRAAALAGDQRREVLAALTAAAIVQMDGTAFHLHVNGNDRALVNDAFLNEVRRRLAREDAEPPALGVDDAPAPVAGGVIVLAADGTQMVDNSFEARRRRLAPQFRQALAGILFADRDEETENAVPSPFQGEG